MAKPDPRSLVARSMTEAQLQRAVVEMASLYGWLWVHSRPGMMRSGRWSTPLMGHKGEPDLRLVRPPRVLFCELKSQAGRVAPEQHTWLDTLAQCPGVESYLWRPSDLLDGTILRTLKGEERP